jgi:hypothetical protein
MKVCSIMLQLVLVCDKAKAVCVGLKLQFQLLNTEAFERIGLALSPHNDLGIKGVMYSEDFLERYARCRTLTGHHVVGTCRMGALNDPRSVVDSELRFVLILHTVIADLIFDLFCI